MATQTIEFAAPSGQTISTVRLFAAGADTIVATAAATERTNSKLIYRAAFTDLPAGRYRLIAINSNSSPIAAYWVDTLAATGTYYAYDLTPTQVEDAVWDATQADHTTAGTMGYFIGGVLIAANFNQRTVQVTGGPNPHIAASVHNAEANSIPAGALTTAAIAEIQSGLATAANQVVLIDGVGFITSVLMGSISDAGTAAETYQIAFGGSTYTVDYSGLDATGNRSTTTRTKT